MEPIAQRVALPGFVKDITTLLEFAKSKEGRDWLKKANAVIAELNVRIAEVGAVDEIHGLRTRAINDRSAAMVEFSEAKEKATALLANVSKKIKELKEQFEQHQAAATKRLAEVAGELKTRQDDVAERERICDKREQEATKAQQDAEALQATATRVKEEYERRVKLLAGRLKAAEAA